MNNLLAVSRSTTGHPPTLQLTLLGAFQVTSAGQTVTRFRSSKISALLVYLAMLYPAAVPRTVLMELLWHGYAERSARLNLRQTLTRLRDALLTPDLLAADNQRVALTVPAAAFTCDALRFRELVEACRRHDHNSITQCAACQARLQQAVELYQGPFLANFPAVDSAPFTAWRLAQQQYFAELFAEVRAALHPTVAPIGNLPPPLTSLIGRTVELTDLANKLQDAVYRCLTLTGPGGVGKTRLACALGVHQQSHFPDGVWLIELSGLAPARPDEAPAQLQDRLATAIAQTLGFTFMGTTPPAVQVTNFLRTKAALLILDSFEHLLTAAAWLPTLLKEAAQVRLLITTRHRLPLQSQLVYAVNGLEVPPEATVNLSAEHLLTQYASLQLFVERAESAGAALPLDHDTLTTIGQLCRFVGGSPWAIELAVALLDRHTPATILAAIQTNYRTLTSHFLDVPLRQRSAAAVFHTSWDLLTSTEAQTLARCAVFRGGFTLAMAQTIAAATPMIIEALVQKSLLQPGGADRYTMHDLVRQFASEQLALDATAATQTYTAHAVHFMALLATWQPTDVARLHFRTAIAQDWANVQAAWQWAVETGAIALLQQGLEGLAEYYNLTELFLEADTTLSRTIERVRQLWEEADTTATMTPEHHSLQHLLAHLLWRHCYLVNSALADTERALPLAQELLTLASALNDNALAARGYYELSVSAYHQSDFHRQEAFLQQALPLAQQYGTIHDQFLCLNLLGVSCDCQYKPTAALHYFQQALALTQGGAYAHYDLMTLNNIGALQVSTGHFAAAVTYFQAALPRAMMLGFQGTAAFITASLGEIALLVGDYAAALPQLTEAYQRYVDLHDHALAAQLLQMLAMLYAESGELRAALTACQRALASAGGNLYAVRHTTLCTLGHLHRRQGEWDAAADIYQQALALSQQLNQRSDTLCVQSYLAAVTFAQGDALTALVAVEPLLTHFATTPFIPQQRPQELLLIAYKILVATADTRAPAVLHQAWSYVQDQAAKIDDPRLRATFLTNIPVNREVAVLVAADLRC